MGDVIRSFFVRVFDGRDFAAMVAGAGASQLVMLIILPVLTRIYSPEDFAVFAVFMAWLGVLSSVSCLRFEIAIPIPEERAEAQLLLWMAFIANGVFVVALALAFAVVLAGGGEWLGLGALGGYVWLLPPAVMLSGWAVASQLWAARHKEFSVIAKSRAWQGVSGAVGQVGLGLAVPGPIGLIVGQILNMGAGGWLLLRQSMKALLERSYSLFELARCAQSYRRYPTISVLEAFSSSAAVQLPILVISTWVAGAELGLLMLAMRVMQAPLGLIGGALSQLYLASASEANREGRLCSYTLAALERAVKVSVGPLIFAGIISPFVFPLIFGASWERSGQLATWMIPWVVMQIICSPISMAMHVLGRQSQAMLIQIAILVIRVGAVSVSVAAGEGYVAETYALSGGGAYALYLIAIFLAVGIRMRDAFGVVCGLWKQLLAWVLGGAAAATILSWAGSA